MLRREFFGVAASVTLVPPTVVGCRLDALVSELRLALANDASVDHFDLVYEPGSAVPLIVAAYGKSKLA